MKTSRFSARSRTSVSAVTVAVLGTSRSRAISPKKSPARGARRTAKASSESRGRARPKERLAAATPGAHHVEVRIRPAAEPFLVPEDVDAILAVLLDLRREVTKIREFLEGDDGEEEETSDS